MNDDLALIDSNLLSYVFDKSEPKKKRICGDLVADCWKGKRKYAVSVQNLSEFYVVVTRKIEKPLPKEVARRFIQLIISFQGLIVVNFDSNTVTSAININVQYGIHYAAGVPVRNIKYYDFRYPNADKMMIVADAQWTEGTDTFNIKLPSDFVFYDRSYSHYAYDSSGSTMKIDGNEISSLGYCVDDSRWQSGQLSSTQLSLDEFHTVSLWQDSYGNRGHSCAAIALIYREA